MKEIIEEYAKKQLEIRIWDDTKGTFLFGSIKELKFTPIKVLRPKEAREKYNIKNDFDLLIIIKTNQYSSK